MMMRGFKISLFVWLAFFLGCSPQSAEECRRDAEGQIKLFISDLKKIETKEDLIRERSSIEKRMLALTDLMIQMNQLEQSQGKENRECPISALFLSEFKRIYQIEGARELMEGFQREALLKLDAYDQSREYTGK